MPILPNPYFESQCPEYLMPIQSQVAELLFGRTRFVDAKNNPEQEI